MDEKKFGNQSPGQPGNPPRTIYELMRLLRDPEVIADEGRRGEITSEVVKMHEVTTLGERLVASLRHAFDTKDKDELRWALDTMQTEVHRGSRQSLDSLRVNDDELAALLKGGHIVLNTATGTHGERIAIDNHSLFMVHDDKYGIEQRQNFAHLFGLDEDGEMRKEF